MGVKPKVHIFIGPLIWFQEQLVRTTFIRISDVAHERDEASRRFTLSIPGEPEPQTKPESRPRLVVAESSDYASLAEHVLTNFSGFVLSFRPKRLYLHNPPARVLRQMIKNFQAKIHRYQYPGITLSNLVEFRDSFGSHIVGQAPAKEQLLSALYRLTTGTVTRPAVLMFYGPSGVGKTETARFIGQVLGGRVVRQQFSMFNSEKFASFLFGGTHSESSFARELLDRESNVILIDEFDKANPVFFSAFYQLFEEGVFEDKNYEVELGSALIICTSNYTSEEDVRRGLGDAVCSRFDSLIAFTNLSFLELREVVARQINKRFAQLSPSELKLIERAAVELALSTLGNGQRNVRRVTKIVDDVISLMLVRAALEHHVAAGTTGPEG